MSPVAGVKVVDADSHLTEPPDLWSSALPAKWKDIGPRVETNDAGEQRWRIGDAWLNLVGSSAVAGNGAPAKRWDEVDPACYTVDGRVKWMDNNGIDAQVLYPNIVALEGHALMAIEDEDLKQACIQINNDHFADFAAQAPGRFVPLASLPFWDIDRSIAEMRRCADLGHKGVIWAATLSRHGLPGTTDPYWDPFYAAAQDLGMSINFHVGVGYTAEQMAIATQRGATRKPDPLAQAADQARRTALGFMANGRTIADLIMSGLCDRFPRLNFVSVESGYGFLPYLIEALDWQWTNPGNNRKFPQRLLPSEYFRRQIYAMFWFEQTTLPLLQVFPDNVMFETDFPHDTSLTPGPGSDSPAPADLVGQHIRDYGVELMTKVCHDNAARVYGLD